jgi:hypothetical protein
VLPKNEVVDIGIGSKNVIQNYCIASNKVDIALFPFGLGAIANHAKSDNSNMVLEWYWWNEEEKVNKMKSSTTDLSKAPFAQLDIAYRATRDIFEGEELTYDYGEDWAEAWANHLANLNQWHINSIIRQVAEENHESHLKYADIMEERPRFLAFIGASENLFLPHWIAIEKEATEGVEDEVEKEVEEEEDEGPAAEGVATEEVEMDGSIIPNIRDWKHFLENLLLENE